MKYPPLADYALIGDCHAAALISRAGSIDWCCLPRFDSDSCFGRLLDWEKGGHFIITPEPGDAAIPITIERQYVPNSLILSTRFIQGDNEACLLDFFAMRRGGRRHPRRELIRVLHGVRGSMRFSTMVSPRLDFGEVRPWIYRLGAQAHAAIGSDTGLLIFGDISLDLAGEHDLGAQISVRAGERRHLALQWVAPEEIDAIPVPNAKAAAMLEAHYDETLQWWRDWTSKLVFHPAIHPGVRHSAVVLKALTYAPTGAIIAAPTTSLPEHIGGERNWDYRYSWIRDSVFTVGALAQLGCASEADGFRRFIQRSAAGNADELQVMYGVDGKRRLPEIALGNLEGWRGSRPVRIGNAAAQQFQSDMYGLLLELSWRWSERRGNHINEHYWDFLLEMVEAAIQKWPEPDNGIWEIRATPRHFVHSKVMCWAAVDRGIKLAQKHKLSAPLDRWLAARQQMRASIEAKGYDSGRGIFVESYGSSDVDAALLLLPTVDFVSYTDERMKRTAEVIRQELEEDGLILRYRTRDGLRGEEGVFLACTFWLAECFACQGRLQDAREIFARANACANDLGLFAEEYDPRSKELLGNFPQGLTHLAQIAAALAIYANESSAPDASSTSLAKASK